MEKRRTGSIRSVTESDVNAVVGLVHELAAYEGMSDQCRLTPARLHTALFGQAPALFGHVDGEVVGIALWSRNFSTWDGVPGIYVEDLFVRPEYRGDGLGRALLSELAAECVRQGYARMEWTVLSGHRWSAHVACRERPSRSLADTAVAGVIVLAWEPS